MSQWSLITALETMIMIGLLLTLAFLGLIVWLIVTYLPMPPVFRTLILIVTAVVVILYLANAFGIVDLPVPRIR